MKVLRYALFPFEPQSAVRSVQTQTWLTTITEEKAKEIEDSYKMAFRSNGKPYWYKFDKNGKMKTLRSKPNYVRTKRYLDKYVNYKKQLQEHKEKIGFIMPQDAFFIWYLMPMPKSWTLKKKRQMAFTLHKNKKDTDNLSKAIKDALAPRKNNFDTNSKTPAMDDRVISSYANAKIWLPDEYKTHIGTLIIEYDLCEFLVPFFANLANIIEIKEMPEVFISGQKNPEKEKEKMIKFFQKAFKEQSG